MRMNEKQMTEEYTTDTCEKNKEIQRKKRINKNKTKLLEFAIGTLYAP